jgi:hypothetical protein
MRWVSLLVLAADLPALADDETKGDKKDEKPASQPPAKSSILAPPQKDDGKHKYVTVNTVAGKVEKVDAKASELTLDVRVVSGRHTKTEKIELTLAEDVKVRTQNQPEQLDENGKPKKLSPDELRKLKGTDPKLPGYAAEPTALQKGQTVQVTLSRLKDASPKKTQGKDKSEKEQLYVTLVLIVSEDRPAAKKK